MRNKVLYLIIFIIIITLIGGVLYKKETDIYLSLAGHSPHDNIDMQVTIDNEIIFSDTVYYSAFIPKKINLPMRLGFHKIFVKSKSLKIEKNKTIFLFLNQYILVEFYDKVQFIRDEPEFNIDIYSNPFYIE